MRIICLPASGCCKAVGGLRVGIQKPEMLGVLACGTTLARPRWGYSRGCSIQSVAGTEALEFVL